jgi:8-oxo-dGTP pyrophosphatase MutT (NUDIX family)
MELDWGAISAEGLTKVVGCGLNLKGADCIPCCYRLVVVNNSVKMSSSSDESMDGSADTELRAGLIIQDAAGCILIVRGPSGKWSFPKGCLKRGESAWDGAVRETREETGLDVEVLAATGKVQLHMMEIPMPHGLYWIVSVRDPSVKKMLTTAPSREVIEMDWVPVAKRTLEGRFLNSDLKTYIEGLLRYLPKEMQRMRERQLKRKLAAMSLG